MDELDVNLVQGWAGALVRCVGDAAEARKRWRRVRFGWCRHPVRPWCLALRASDTRITPWTAAFGDRRAWANGEEHEIDLGGEAMQKLCAPVRLPWPGVPLSEAARLLGRHSEALRKWLPVKPGRKRGDRRARQPERFEDIIDPAYPLCVRYEPAQCHGHRGYDVPVVWSLRALDPGASRGESPHAVWGTLWQTLSETVPCDVVQPLVRVPRMRPRLGAIEHKGWDWVCPGREGQPCGRRVQTLYVPMPVWTIPKALGLRDALKVEERDDDMPRLIGQWQPGWCDPWAGQRHFACLHCWAVRRVAMCDSRGWNQFISAISGGLLYGHEVERPEWVRYVRKQPKRKRRGRRKACDAAEASRAVSARSVVALGDGAPRQAV